MVAYNWWFVLAGVGAAFAFAASTCLKHLCAQQVPDGQSLRPRALGRFVRATVVHRLWLGGILADGVGLVLQMLALHLGSLSAVQALLILSLPLALVLRSRGPGRMRAGDLGWVCLVVAGLGCFVVLAGSGGRRPGGVDAGTDAGAAVTAGIVGLVIVVGCVAVGRLRRGSGCAAASLGVVVGIIYAGTAALLKSITDILARNPISLLWSWQFYAVVALGAVGLVLNQVAFQSGPLRASLPAISAVDPLASIVVGVWVFGEHMRLDTPTATLLAASLLVLGVGVIRLARSAAGARPGGASQPAGAAVPRGTDGQPDDTGVRAVIGVSRPDPARGDHASR